MPKGPLSLVAALRSWRESLPAGLSAEKLSQEPSARLPALPSARSVVCPSGTLPLDRASVLLLSQVWGSGCLNTRLGLAGKASGTACSACEAGGSSWVPLAPRLVWFSVNGCCRLRQVQFACLTCADVWRHWHSWDGRVPGAARSELQSVAFCAQSTVLTGRPRARDAFLEASLLAPYGLLFQKHKSVVTFVMCVSPQ